MAKNPVCTMEVDDRIHPFCQGRTCYFCSVKQEGA